MLDDNSEEELEHIVTQVGSDNNLVYSKGESLQRDPAEMRPRRGGEEEERRGDEEEIKTRVTTIKSKSVTPTSAVGQQTSSTGGVIRKSSLSNSRNSNLNDSNPATPKPKKTVGFDLRPRVLYPDEDAEITNIMSSDDVGQSDDDDDANTKKTSDKSKEEQQQNVYDLPYQHAVQYKSNFLPKKQQAYMEYRNVNNPAVTYRIVRERKLSQ